jgi:C-terminal domain 7 of the ABC-three component (ABC-3C) systems/Cap4, dsDNA endonuclease domain
VTSSDPSHSAAASALGYLYQSQWPLVELLRRARDEPDSALTLELHDDVAWEEDGTPTELLQVKHHVNATGRLGDKDDDLWRTIRVWMDAHAPGDPSGPTLTLLTTATAAGGSAAAALRPAPLRDVAEGQRLLEWAARESTAQASQDVRQRFLGLSDAERTVFVNRINVLDTAPTIGEALEEELRRTLYLVLPKDHEQTFIDQLWGWWHRLAVALLRDKRATVTALDVKAKIDELRNSFAGDNLPTLVRREDIDFDVDQTYASRPFVEQLRWIALTAKLLQKAMIDYYRAYTQSALWVEDNLVALDELQTFEEDLIDEWERQFEFMKMKLPEGADAPSQERAGQELFRFVTENSAVRLRAYDEPFYTHGTLHGLADDGRVGWHPEFQARLEALLLGGAA